MKIERIRTYHLRTELTPAEAFAYSQARVAARTAMLVEIVADDGRSGWGEAHGPPAPSKTIIDELYAPRLVGRDPMDTTVIWEELYAVVRGHSPAGHLRLRRFHRGRSYRGVGQYVGRHGLSAGLGQRGGAPREHPMGGLAGAGAIIEVPDRPGLGLEVDRAVLERYAVTTGEKRR